MFGPPGCGKGTQSARLSEQFGIPAISTGEMLRQECSAGTKLGRLAKSVLDEGKLVGDDLVNEMLLSRIRRDDCRAGFILDGYPRTVEQAVFLGKELKQKDLDPVNVIQLVVPVSTLLERLSTREQCPLCHHIYNTEHSRPHRPGICDKDGGRLERRTDDQIDVIATRLLTYDQLTAQVQSYYFRDNYHRIDGTLPADVVYEHILARLEVPLLGQAASQGQGTGTGTPGNTHPFMVT